MRRRALSGSRAPKYHRGQQTETGRKGSEGRYGGNSGPPHRDGHLSLLGHRGLDAAPEAARPRALRRPAHAAQRRCCARPSAPTRGSEIDRQGDAFFFVFRSAGDRGRGGRRGAAGDGEHDWPEDGAVRVRIGVHTGEAAVNGDGYVGFAVHQAARIGDLGHGGQILVSRTTAALVEHELPVRHAAPRPRRDARCPGSTGPRRSSSSSRRPARPLPAARRPPAERRARRSPKGRRCSSARASSPRCTPTSTAASCGAGRLIAIEGRAGIGKTRLLAEARAIATQAGVTRAERARRRARAGLRLRHRPPALRAGARRGDDATSAPSCSAAPAALAAAALRRRAAHRAPTRTTTDVSFAMLHGLYWLAANVALRRPAMIAIDDLHWADGPSLRWLAHLQRRLEGLPLLVAVATRPPDQSTNEAARHRDPRRPGRGDRAADGARARVGRRTSPASSSAREPDDDVRRRVLDRDRRQPALRRGAARHDQARGPRAVARERGARHEIGPEPVARAVSLRLSRLPSEATVLARAVAVLGGRAELRHAAALAGLERELASHAATTLARADLLRLRDAARVHPPGRAHRVYDDMSTAERIAAHRRAAHDPRRAPAPSPSRSPCTSSSRSRTATRSSSRRCSKAAQRALQRGSSDVAVSLLRRALDEPPTPEQLRRGPPRARPRRAPARQRRGDRALSARRSS